MIAPSLSSLTFAALVALSSVDASAIPASSSISPPPSISARGAGGINKDGSGLCPFQYVFTMPDLQKKVDKIAPGTTFVAGEKIACASYDDECLRVNKPRFGESCGGVCASLCENTASATVEFSTKSNDADRNAWVGDQKNTFGDVIGDLRWFGAKFCGTAPLVRDGSNDNSKGCITVNYVTDVCDVAPDLPCKANN